MATGVVFGCYPRLLTRIRLRRRCRTPTKSQPGPQQLSHERRDTIIIINNNNSDDNVHGAVNMTKVIARVYPVHLIYAD